MANRVTEKTVVKTDSYSIEKIRADFPILTQTVHDHPLIYLDNAATSQKPQVVFDAISNYYRTSNANVHRGIHTLSEAATAAYESSRDTVARFINGKPEEIIFVRNATEGLNLLARGLAHLLEPNDEILLSAMEHHSNIVPWQQLAKRTGAVIKYVELTPDWQLDLKDLKKKLSPRVKIIAIAHASNVLGTINPISIIHTLSSQLAPRAILIVDGAQAVPHLQVNVQELGVDAYVFSGHKMCGPTGIGVVWAKHQLLEKLQPQLFGGDMILEVSRETASWNDIPARFEAGTPNVSGAIGLATAIDYLEKIGMDNVENYLQEITTYGLKRLEEINELTLYGPSSAENRLPIFSFSLNGVHPHDVAQLLDEQGIAVRSGHLCAQPLMQLIKQPALTRASCYVYNTKEEIDRLIVGINHVKRVFHNRGISPQNIAESFPRNSAK